MNAGGMFSQADSYERFMGRWSRRLAPALVHFADVRDGDAVLDVGCGTGSLTFALRDATQAARVTGVDPSGEYLARAAETSEPRLRFVQGDARQLPFPDAAFDRTLSMLVLNFVPDRAGAVREMLRVTRPGGLVVAAVWDYGAGMEMLRVFWDAATALDPEARSRDEANMPLCKQGELGELWKRCGLESVHEAPLSAPLQFESFEDYWAPFLLGQGPAGVYVAGLSEPRRMTLRDRLRERLLVTGDQPIQMRALAWAVKGRVGPLPRARTGPPAA